MFGWKKNNEKSDSENLCPYCKHHCSRDHIRCDKGKEYFNLPLGKRKSGGAVVSSSSQHHSHHHHDSSHSSSHSASRTNIPNYSLEDLDTMEMTSSELTYRLLCKWRYFFRDMEKYGNINADLIFSVLTEEETDTLNAILRKGIEAWETPAEEEA